MKSQEVGSAGSESGRSLRQLGRWWRNYERFQWFARKERIQREAADVEALSQQLQTEDVPGSWERILVKLALDGSTEAGEVLARCRVPRADEDLALFLDVARREWEANHR